MKNQFALREIQKSARVNLEKALNEMTSVGFRTASGEHPVVLVSKYEGHRHYKIEPDTQEEWKIEYGGGRKLNHDAEERVITCETRAYGAKGTRGTYTFHY